MIKNIGKLKQWTGEKFGSAKTTLQTEDFQRLEVETERKRVAYEKLHASALLMQSQLVKKKISPEDNKSKRLPIDMFGVCMSNYGNEFTEDTPLGTATINFGQAQSRLASSQEDYAESMQTEYIEKLDEGLQQFKEYQALRKKLESRRLDYDSKLSRLQKSKKENPGLEQELQAAKMKFEDSEYDVIQKMASLQEFEDEHYQTLQNFLDMQYEFFARSLEVLTEVKANWGTPMPHSTPSLTNARSNTVRRPPNGLSRTSSNNSAEDSGNTAMNLLRSAAPRKLSVGRNPSTESSSLNLASTMRQVPSRNNSTFSDRDDFSVPNSRTAPPPAPPVLPRRLSHATQEVPMKNQRKAVYDFGGDNVDELSFRIGDVIQVIEEVDEGWWLGEVAEPNGNVRRGIFPVNYTELVVVQQQSSSAGPPMPARPALSQSNSIQHYNYIPEEETYTAEPNGYHQQENSSPFGDINRTSNNNSPRSLSYTRPNQPSRTLSTNTSSSGISPASSPVPQFKTTATSKRAPPPPPPSSRTPPASSSIRSNTMKPNGARTAPSTPQIHVAQTDGYFDSNATPACGDCGCDEFTANIFKKGHCNNCFHKHF